VNVLTQVVALVGILSTGVVYGTDVFCALVQRPALARVDDAALVTVMGNVHRYGDRRMPVPGVLALVASAAAGVLGLFAGSVLAAVGAGSALVLLIGWTIVYTRVSAPINRRLTAAADEDRTPPDARALQIGWDRVIVLRAVLQGLAVLGLGIAVIAG
jgi:hypothetical protein